MLNSKVLLFILSLFILSVVPVHAGNYDTLTDGLMGWWKGDETSANSCSGGTNDSCDSSGNGYDGAWGNEATFTAAGKFGYGMSFDGTGDYVSMGDLNNFEFTSNFTVAGWVYPTSLDAGDAAMASKGGGDPAGWTIGVLGTSDVVLFETNSTNYSGNTVLVDDTWYHIAVTVDEAGWVRIFLDGELDNTPTQITMTTNGSANVNIGGAGDTAQPWQGTIDEVRVYNRALSDQEVEKLYNWSPAPVAYWNLNENTGTSAINDRSGNANGANMSSTMTEEDWGQGKYGSGLVFDGSDDYLQTDNTDLIDVTNSYTLGAWIYPTSWGEGGNFGTVITKIDYLDFQLNDSCDCMSLYNPDSSTGATSADNSIVLNQWHYVSAVYDGSSVATVYVDGVDQTNDSSITATDSTNTFIVGADGTASPDTFEGIIDEVRIYDYARNASQIIEDMNGGHPIGGSPEGSQVGWWKFDEGYGDTVYDSSPQGNNGDLAGSGTTCPQASDSACPTWSDSGRFGQSLDFEIADTTDDYVTVSDDASLDPDDITITAWINPESAHTGNFVNKGDNSGYRFRVNSGSTLSFLDRGATNSITSNYTYTTGEWVHAAITGDSTGLKMYINGILDISNTTAYGGPDTADDLEFGVAFAEYYDGQIDEVKIYSTALTGDQIFLDYNTGRKAVFGSTGTDSTGNVDNSFDREHCIPGDSSTCRAPIAYWPFDENTGTSTIYDQSGSEYSGTMNGSMTAADWVPGVHGSALDFDGSNDDIDTNANIMDETAAYSISMWLYPHAIGNDDTIIGNDNDNNNFALYYDGGGTGAVVLCNNNTCSNQGQSVASLMTTNEWQHFVVTYDGTDTANFYLNGVESNGADVTVGETSFTSNLVIGCLYSVGACDSDNAYDGLMDELKIFDFELTPAQVWYQFNRGGPVGWWTFDECSGDTAYDRAVDGNGDSMGNHLTYTIGGTGTNDAVGSCDSEDTTESRYNGRTGKYDRALDTDGTDDYAGVDDTAIFDMGTDDMTLSAWVKTTDDTGFIISKAWASPYYSMSTTGVGYARVRLHNGTSSTDLDSTTDITDDAWHHVVGTYDRDGNMSIYVDGVLENTVDISSDSAIDVSNTNPLTFGANCISGYGSCGNYRDGLIDDVRIYRYAMTDEQVQVLYNYGAVNFGN